MVQNMFCNLAATVVFLLFFVLEPICFNKYIFLRYKGRPTQCLICLTGVAVGVGKTRTQVLLLLIILVSSFNLLRT